MVFTCIAYIHTYHTLPYLTLPYITLHYITSHYITLHYLHTHIYLYIHDYIYIHKYIYIYINNMYVCVYVCLCVCVYVCMCVLDDRGWSRMAWKKPQLNISKIMVLLSEAEDDQEHVKTLLTSRALRLCSSAQGTGRSWCLCLCIWQSVINASKCV